LIFAVTEKQVRVYSQLKNFIPGSETGRLADDSSNIVDLVRDNYRVSCYYMFGFLLTVVDPNYYPFT